MFGVVDMMVCIGTYKSRASASNTWRLLRGTPHIELGGVTFWVESTEHSNKMDFCTIADFLDHVLPHVTGELATSIKVARSRTSTLVGTGSDMAIRLTEINARSVMTADQSVRNMVAAVREEVEEKMAGSKTRLVVMESNNRDVVRIPSKLSVVRSPRFQLT